MTHEPLLVVGIGDDGPAGLTATVRQHIEQAAILAGGKRHLEFFPNYRGERIVIDADPDRWLAQIRASYRKCKTVVLASGDPLFYGVGRLLLDSFPREDLVFVPHVSSVQLAFARLKETWNDARVVSLHGRPMDCLLPALDERAGKIAVFTDGTNHPTAVGHVLCEHGLGDRYRIWVCENLGGEDERVTDWSPAEIMGQVFSPLNIVVLIRTPGPAVTRETAPPLLGIPESALQHQGEPSRGLITKREIRLLSLCYFELRPGEVFWDIGAGSGSVAIEAARLAPSLRVFAVERSRKAVHDIEENCKTLCVGRTFLSASGSAGKNACPTGVCVIHGEAPEALVDLPDPDAVFIGGSGGRLTDILATCTARLRPGGRLVLNCITLENFARAWEWLREKGWNPEATSVQLAHSRSLGNLHCFEPDNPIVIVRAKSPG